MKTFFPPLKGAPGNTPQHLRESLSSPPTHPAFFTDTVGLFTASCMRGSFAWAGWGHEAAEGRSRCLRSRVGRNGSHLFMPRFLASHLGNFRMQPGNKTQDNSLSAGQPAEPKAEAGVIPDLLPDKATFKAATNLLRFGARAPPASDGSTRV